MTTINLFSISLMVGDGHDLARHPHPAGETIKIMLTIMKEWRQTLPCVRGSNFMADTSDQYGMGLIADLGLCGIVQFPMSRNRFDILNGIYGADNPWTYGTTIQELGVVCRARIPVRKATLAAAGIAVPTNPDDWYGFARGRLAAARLTHADDESLRLWLLDRFDGTNKLELWPAGLATNTRNFDGVDKDRCSASFDRLINHPIVKLLDAGLHLVMYHLVDQHLLAQGL